MKSLSQLLHFISLLLLIIPSNASDSSSSSSNLFSKLTSFWSSKNTYQLGDPVDLLVNTVTSQYSNIPYAYYKLPFVCPGSSSVKPVHLSLAEIINGDRFWQSDYKLNFGQDSPCLRICDRIINQSSIKKTIEFIKNDYIADWVIDDLPASTTFINDDGINDPKKYYIPGFSLGYTKDDEYFVNNHLMMVIRYNVENNDKNKNSIVGFEIYPKSVSDFHCPGASKNFQNFKLDPNAESQVIPFTYSVYWREEQKIDYDNRWKMYIDSSSIDSSGNLIISNSNNKTIHWVSLINSLVILFFVSIIVACILLLTFRSNLNLNSDLNLNLNLNSKFNKISKNSFNEPKFLTILCILSGSGIQLIFTLFGSGLLSFIFFRDSFGKENKTILSLTISVLIIGGFFAGFSSIQQFILFNNNSLNKLTLKKTIIISSLSGSFLITLCLIIIVITNFLIFEKDSPKSIKFGTFILLLFFYALLQIPISVIGGIISKNFTFLSKKIPKFDDFQQKKKNLVSNDLTTPFYLKFPFPLLILGFFPCSIVFIESKFLYMTLLVERSSISFYMYGFIILAAILLLIIMIEIGIVASYLRLLKINSHFDWQWWMFLTCASSIWIYLVPFSIYHLVFKMKLIDSGSPVLYMVYSTILNTIISIACGSLALWSATFFVYAVVLSTGSKKE